MSATEFQKNASGISVSRHDNHLHAPAFCHCHAFPFSFVFEHPKLFAFLLFGFLCRFSSALFLDENDILVQKFGLSYR